jgi:hypothetical protein
LKRFFSWLTYRPLSTGQCCKFCYPGKHPPLYAYFPCQAGCGPAGCGAGITPAAHTTLKYVKEPNPPAEPAPQPVAELPAPGESVSAKPAEPARTSTYRPTTIAQVMPVLAPEQFRRPDPAKAGVNPMVMPK